MLIVTAILLPTVLLVLLATVVCLLLVATLALVVLLERTGTDLPATTRGLRQRFGAGRVEGASPSPAPSEDRAPWSRRTPPASATAQEAPAPAPAPPVTAPAAPARSARAKAAPTRTRPVRTPKPVGDPVDADDRQAAMDRLFAPLAEERDPKE